VVRACLLPVCCLPAACLLPACRLSAEALAQAESLGAGRGALPGMGHYFDDTFSAI